MLLQGEQSTLVARDEIVSRRRLCESEQPVIVRVWRALNARNRFNHACESSKLADPVACLAHADALLEIWTTGNGAKFLELTFTGDQLEAPVAPGFVKSVRRRAPDE